MEDLQTFWLAYPVTVRSTFDGHSNLGQLNQAMHKVWIRRLKVKYKNQLKTNRLVRNKGGFDNAEVLRIKLPFVRSRRR